MFEDFMVPGKASFIVGGQWGSEAKGAAAAWMAHQLWKDEAEKPGGNMRWSRFDYVTTNAGAQAGHTSIHKGVKRIVYHLPTAPLVESMDSTIYLNAGSIIDPVVLEKEIKENWSAMWGAGQHLFIHPNAAVITPECREAEGRPDSAQTRIASTRKGVGEALARKVLRSGEIARNHPYLRGFVRRLDLNNRLTAGATVLVEVPQGHGLSLDGKFYPHCTSRNCTVGQAASDAAIHPSFVGPVMLVLRTYPIRVGNISAQATNEHTNDSRGQPLIPAVGYSGDCYLDQEELTWGQLGVEPEITTVTKRVRRVFSFSLEQMIEAMSAARPSHVFLSHCDYLGRFHNRTVAWYVDKIRRTAEALQLSMPKIAYSHGPATSDVKVWEG